MSTEENKALFRRWIRAWNDGTVLDVIGDVFAADVVYHGPSEADSFTGIDTLRAMLAGTFKALRDVRVTIERMTGEGDMLAGWLTVRGVHAGEWMGIAATGKEVTMADVGFARFADGKVVEVWEMADGLGVLQQLGAFPAAEPAEA